MANIEFLCRTLLLITILTSNFVQPIETPPNGSNSIVVVKPGERGSRLPSLQRFFSMKNKNECSQQDQTNYVEFLKTRAKKGIKPLNGNREENKGAIQWKPSNVWKWKRESDGKEVAIKEIVINRVYDDGVAKSKLHQQVDLLNLFWGEGVTPDVNCVGGIDSQPPLYYYMMDYYPRATTLEDSAHFYNPLYENIEKKWAKLVQVMLQVLSKIHDKGVIHRNLGRDNWLLTTQGELYLVGFSKAQKNGNSKDDGAGVFTDLRMLGKTIQEIYSDMMNVLHFHTFDKVKGETYKKIHAQSANNCFHKEFVTDISSGRSSVETALQKLEKYLL